MGSHHPIRKTVIAHTPEIPDKLYFRIGDVAKLCEVPAYVLRFWETEFPQLKPNKGGTGQRLYRKRDVEMALRIKSLLYDQGYTIPGARQVFKAEIKPAEMKVAEMRPSESRPAEPRALEPQLVVSSTPADTATRADLRRDAKLNELRAEMAALLAALSKSAIAVTKDAKVQSIKHRLSVEPSRSRQLSLDEELF